MNNVKIEDDGNPNNKLIFFNKIKSGYWRGLISNEEYGAKCNEVSSCFYDLVSSLPKKVQSNN